MLDTHIRHFFQKQHFVIVSTIDANGRIHNSCKDILTITPRGLVYIFDLYRAKTLENLRNNPVMSLTAVEEHLFKGYCLKGRGQLIDIQDAGEDIFKIWEAKLAARMSARLVRNLKEEKIGPKHPESLFPDPKYCILMKVEEIVDLTPKHIKI